MEGDKVSANGKGKELAIPNPGSLKAVSAGCRCPVMDNGHGRGYMGHPGIFVINVDCPLHGHKVRND